MLAAIFAECGKAAPCIAYIGAANGDKRDFYERMSAYLREAGAGRVPLAPVARPPEARRILAAADMVFVSGGDVERGMQALVKARLAKLLERLYANGVPFFASSAGSIMLAREWVRWRDPNDDATAEVFPCLGLAKVLCDMHGEGEDWEELRVLLALRGEEGEVGYGVPRGVALRVEPDGTASAVGGAAHCFALRGGVVQRLPDMEARR